MPTPVLPLPLYSQYESPPIMQTLQRLLLKHSDMRQNRAAKKLITEKKKKKDPLLVERCFYVACLGDEPDSEDSDAEEARHRNDRQRQVVSMIKDGTLLPKELAFLSFVVDEQIDEFWLQPRKYVESHANDTSHSLTMQNIKQRTRFWPGFVDPDGEPIYGHG